MMKNLIGKTVVGRDGFSEITGKVIGEEKPTYGFDSWVIEWEDGTVETHTKHTLKHKSEHVGIGVYWIETKQVKRTFYIENEVEFLQ